MRKFVLCALLAAALPLPATALSCRSFSMIDAFQEADQAAEEYVIVRGALEYNSRNAPTSGRAVLPGRVVGQALSPNGFSVQVSVPVRVSLSCAGSWCPPVRPGPDKLIFLKKQGAAYVIDATACQPWVFDKPTEAMEDAMIACMNGACPTPRRPVPRRR